MRSSELMLVAESAQLTLKSFYLIEGIALIAVIQLT